MGSRPAEQSGSYEGEGVRHAAGCQSSGRTNQRGDTHKFPRAIVLRGIYQKLDGDWIIYNVVVVQHALYKNNRSSDPYIQLCVAE